MTSRKDIHQMIQQILTLYGESLTVNASVLIRTRQCHQITYIYDTMFATYDEHQTMQYYTKFLIELLNPKSPEYEVCSQQATEAFKAILGSKPKDPKSDDPTSPISSMYPQIIDNLINKISFTKYEPFFEILMTQARSYVKCICEEPSRLYKMVDALVKRSQAESATMPEGGPLSAPMQNRHVYTVRVWNRIGSREALNHLN